jgi:hypothetical protein
VTIDRESQIVEMEATDRKAVTDDEFVRCLVDGVKGKRVSHRPLKPGITALDSHLVLHLREGGDAQPLTIQNAPWLHR